MIRRFTFTSPRWRTPADVCPRRYERIAMFKGFKEFIAQGNALELAVAVYFAIVLPMNKVKERLAREKAEEEAKEVTDVELLTEIRDLLSANAAKQ